MGTLGRRLESFASHDALMGSPNLRRGHRPVSGGTNHRCPACTRKDDTLGVSIRQSNSNTTHFPNDATTGSVALYLMHCNFVRIHRTLSVTPAMEARE